MHSYTYYPPKPLSQSPGEEKHLSVVVVVVVNPREEDEEEEEEEEDAAAAAAAAQTQLTHPLLTQQKPTWKQSKDTLSKTSTRYLFQLLQNPPKPTITTTTTTTATDHTTKNGTD
jgi:hypothetical protein